MNQLFEAATLALQAIWANKLRSLFTVLGNIVAVTSIIAVVSLVQGLNASVSSAITSRVGADQFQVTRSGPVFTEEERLRVQSNPQVTLADAEAIRRFSPHVSLVVAQASTQAEVKYHDQTLSSLNTLGVTKDYVNLPDTRVAVGRAITPAEFDNHRAVVMLGADAADRLFGPLNPLDKLVSIAGAGFRVVGVTEKIGADFLGNSQDEYAVIPLAAYQRIFNYRQSLVLTIRPTDPSLVEPAKDDVTLALRVHRRLRPNQKDNFGVLSADSLLGIYQQATSGIFAILIGVVALSLVVGGIVIMNIMLMVVSERTREIGLRKSLGARRRDILWQVLTESVTLSTSGGIVGTSLGFLAAYTISRFSPLPAIVETWSIVLGIGMTAIVGIGFGMYPAMRAASLDPIEALRRE